MNLLFLTVVAALVCGIYAPLPPHRGDASFSNNPFAIETLFYESGRKPLGPRNRMPRCYDHQIMKDQVFDDRFICTDKLSYPRGEIDYAFSLKQNRHFKSYVQLSAACFDDRNYYSDHLAVPNQYSYQCVCSSNRRLITAVFYRNQRCHVVEPEQQRIYYAFCEGRCNLAYGAIDGYYCVNKGWAARTFLVYCEANTEAFMDYTHGLHFNNTMLGGFYYATHTVPTYCGCRSYTGCNQGHAVPGVIV